MTAYTMARDVLAYVEWVECDDGDGKFCPWCTGLEKFGHATHCKLAAVIAALDTDQAKETETLLAEVARLQTIEAAAIAQSEYIQVNGMTEYELARLQAEVDELRHNVTANNAMVASYADAITERDAEITRLRAALNLAEEYMSASGIEHFHRSRSA
jgi:hypothetical protein